MYVRPRYVPILVKRDHYFVFIFVGGDRGGGGLLQKINIIRFFVIVRCGNDCYKTVLVHNKLFDSISQVLVRSLTMNCYICLVIFTSPMSMTCYLYIFIRLWFVYIVCDLFIFPLLVEPCWINLCYSGDCYSRGLHTKLWIIWRGVWVKCGAILAG